MGDNKSCTLCSNYREEYCKHWRIKVTDLSVAETCKKFSIQQNLNKGMQIRKNKLDKKAKERARIKPEQQDTVCFVEYSEKIIEKINGKYRRPTNSRKGNGLQIKNKIFLSNGHFKMVNRSSLKITRRYDDIPKWANKKLIDLYNEAKTSGDTKKLARKRCNTCEHFIYSVGTEKNKTVDGYRCEISGMFTRNYQQLMPCMAPKYKRKKTDKATQ